MRRNIDLVDLVSGLFLIGIALIALALVWRLRVGTVVEMGPGYAPQLFCYMQIALGALIAVRSIFGGARTLESWAPRPILWILASVTFFGLAIERLGLAVAVVGLVILSCLAHRGTNPLHAALLGFGLAAFSVVVFVTALGLPIPVWPNVGH